MISFFLNIYDFFQRKKRLCWALMVAATCILLAMVASLRYNENGYEGARLTDEQFEKLTDTLLYIKENPKQSQRLKL